MEIYQVNGNPSQVYTWDQFDHQVKTKELILNLEPGETLTVACMEADSAILARTIRITYKHKRGDSLILDNVTYEGSIRRYLRKRQGGMSYGRLAGLVIGNPLETSVDEWTGIMRRDQRGQPIETLPERTWTLCERLT